MSQMSQISMIRTLAKTGAMIAMMIATLAAGSVAFADTPAKPAADTKADKPAAKPADKPADKPAAAKKDTVSDVDAQRFYAFIEKLVAIVVANQDDCTKMATAVNAHVDANKALIKDAAAMKQQNKELPPAIKEKMAKKFKDEMEPAITKKCSKDKAVMDAFQKIKA